MDVILRDGSAIKILDGIIGRQHTTKKKERSLFHSLLKKRKPLNYQLVKRF